MPEELQELSEHAEHAQHDPTLVPVTVSMAILAVLVAVVGLLGHRAHTEELLNQTRVTDTWAEYQAKNIRLHSYEQFLDLLAIADFKGGDRVEKTKQKYQQDIKRYEEDREKLQDKARDLEKEVEQQRRTANRFDLGEVCLEAALVITSMTLLTRKRLYWMMGLLLATLGLGVAVTGFFVP
jgi:predicted ribosome quality control (RQC) complex YloA/Tae2 family protein